MNLTKIEIPLRTKFYLVFSNCKKKLIKKIKKTLKTTSTLLIKCIFILCVYGGMRVWVCVYVLLDKKSGKEVRYLIQFYIKLTNFFQTKYFQGFHDLSSLFREFSIKILI